MKQKLLTTFLTLICVFSLTLGLPACGESGSRGLEYTLSYDSESFTVSGIGECTDTDIVIPSTYNGLPVTTIGSSAFANCTSIKSLDMPTTITTIEDCAFMNCIALKEIELPTDLEYLGKYVLYGCDSINSVTFSFGFSTEIGEVNCFIYLFGAAMANSTGMLSNSVAIHPTLVDVTVNGEIVPESAFSAGCYFVKRVTISDSVTTICENAFNSNCLALESVTIGNGVTTIGKNAFRGCTSLNNVTFKNTSSWTVSDTNETSGGTDIDVTDTEQNAIYLTSTYLDYYWHRNEN